MWCATWLRHRWTSSWTGSHAPCGLVLADDGGAAAGLVSGFGLRSLAERARELGGSFEARNGERGVEITGIIPTQEEK